MRKISVSVIGKGEKGVRRERQKQREIKVKRNRTEDEIYRGRIS